MNAKVAVAWFKDKYPDAYIVKRGSYIYYYDCKESRQRSSDCWRMCICIANSLNPSVTFCANELNPDLTKQVRCIVAEMMMQERRRIMRQLDEHIEHCMDPAIADALRRVKDSISIPIVSAGRPRPKKGKKK